MPLLNYPHMEYDVCYLWHDDTDVVDALYDRLAVTGDCHRPLCAVGQHLTGDLDTRSSHLKKVKKYKYTFQIFSISSPLSLPWSCCPPCLLMSRTGWREPQGGKWLGAGEQCRGWSDCLNPKKKGKIDKKQSYCFSSVEIYCVVFSRNWYFLSISYNILFPILGAAWLLGTQ